MNVLITGATKGIGRAIALEMASNGFNLALCARNISDLESLKSQILKLYPNIKVLIKETDCSKKLDVLDFAAFSLDNLSKFN